MRTPLRIALKLGSALVGAIVLFLLFLSWPTHTPAIVNPDGTAIPGSLAEEEWVMLNGLSQWTLTRGRDRDAPILLVLHGGPGAGEFAWFRAYNSDLENAFVVVHWDQRGAGKSFDADTPPETMKFETFISDIDQLVDHLRTKFGRERIAILGHSWGTLLGTTYVAQHPDKVSAYVGTGQIADMRANEARSYEFVLGEARRTADKTAISELKEIGPPPYGVDETMIQRGWLTHFGGGLTRDRRSLVSLIWTALSVPEFNLLDLVALARSAYFSMGHLWSDVGTLNLDQTYLKFEVPVFFILGRFDEQTPSSLAEAYFERLQAPQKELFYIEDAAHSPPWEDPDRFNQILIETIKPRLLPDK